jgi:hypothetical protein
MKLDRLLRLSLDTKCGVNEWHLMIGDGLESGWITRLHFKTLHFITFKNALKKYKIVTGYANSLPSASLASLNIAFTWTFNCCRYIPTIRKPA